MTYARQLWMKDADINPSILPLETKIYQSLDDRELNWMVTL